MRVQNKFLPNEGCLRMFSLLIKDPPSNPRLPHPSLYPLFSLRASSPSWASQSSLARTRERGASRLGRSLARFRETRFTRPNRRACSQAREVVSFFTKNVERGNAFKVWSERAGPASPSSSGSCQPTLATSSTGSRGVSCE